METVLRELGVGDLAIPKRMRKLAASSQTLLQAYADASAHGEEALAAGIAEMFPFLREGKEGASLHLAHYLKRTTRALEHQPVAALAAGEVRFPKVN
jgi:cytochrome b pre-mRNA-processing protein 3